ncbi:hypothetical protein GRF29_44g1897170 [Pseudopithomyces chartarum]|uniref:UBC core domain-containing protein n=1 Tax=Pseudopithomyces chartarum TaxID=1892770 RepID=A0AAN6LYM4_9PLEO|nr:hypothetical protein GRF29_44g1897170 [Pseudopithomyces chartarum]
MPLPASSPALISFRRQQLLVDFSSLRHARLDGVFVTITPGEPSLWSAVLFVRKGPYAPAVLRFHISFPPSYPSLPPLVTFSTDVFHPLLTPLTTYTYTTGSSDTDTVSATDDERLPPGGFSLRHGFPQWFGRARPSAASSRDVSGSGLGTPAAIHTPNLPIAKDATQLPVHLSAVATSPTAHVSIVGVLDYIRSTFNDEQVLDSIAIEAAANPSAYHAWRAYRAAALHTQHSSPTSPTTDSQASSQGRSTQGSTLVRNRRPGEWNWEGVWEERVRKAVKASLSEPVLFGGAAGEDVIRFRNGDEEMMAKMQKQLESLVPRAAEI